MHIKTQTDFQTDARQSLSQLVSASANLVAELRQHSQKPADVIRALNLDRKLGWQLFRIATASDPMLAGTHLPTPASVRRLLESAKRIGVEPKVRDRLADAFEECEALIQRHAVDRASFSLMAAATIESVDVETITVADRRAAFKAQSRILGVTAFSAFRTFIFHPGNSSSELGDVVSLRGVSELIPIRPQLRWPISWARSSTSDLDHPTSENIFRPLKGCKSDGCLSIAEQFSSHPLPKIEHHREQDGSIRSDLALEGVGRTHATSVVLGYHAHGELTTQRNVDNSSIRANFDIRVPCEYSYLDVLVHPDLGWSNQFRPRVFGDHFQPLATPHGRDHDLLPLHCEVTQGTAYRITAVQPPLPNYQELLKWTCANVGWDLAEFEATRVVIEYPVMPSTLVLEMPL